MVERGWRSITKQSEGKASESQHWMDRAKCKDWDFKKNGDPFFPVSPTEASASEARAICAECPVAIHCEYYAMEKRTTREHGVFGGTIPKARISHERRSSRMRRQNQTTKEETKS